MGINMSGVMLRDYDLKRDASILESLFDRKVVSTRVESWDFDRQYDSINSNDIVVLSNGTSSSAYLGSSFHGKAGDVFVDNNVHEITGDYLYYSFSETSMMFCIMHRKNGKLHEDYYTNGEHIGSNVIGIKPGTYSAQEGLELSLLEFDLMFEETEVVVYTFEKTTRLKPKPKTIRKSQTVSADGRYYIHDYSVYLMRVMTGQLNASKEKNHDFHQKMASIGVHVTPLSFDQQRFLRKKKLYKDETVHGLKKSRKVLLEGIIDEPNGFRYMEELVYVQRLIQMGNEGTYSQSPVWIWIKRIGGLLLGLAAIGYAIYRLTK